MGMPDGRGDFQLGQNSRSACLSVDERPSQLILTLKIIIDTATSLDMALTSQAPSSSSNAAPWPLSYDGPPRLSPRIARDPLRPIRFP